ncbi:hypothetical protein ASE92_14155 [Pedobacter sp. Leaf41]|nr:hypothetical protein ASE92_14155 [Pedobacter sp. Leaf41]
MEGENVKAYVATFKNHKPRHRVFCDSSSQLVMPLKVLMSSLKGSVLFLLYQDNLRSKLEGL